MNQILYSRILSALSHDSDRAKQHVMTIPPSGESAILIGTNPIHYPQLMCHVQVLSQHAKTGNTTRFKASIRHRAASCQFSTPDPASL